MGWKLDVHTETLTQMINVGLFITVKIGERLRCPSVCERINRHWHSQTIEYYSAIKRNEPSSYKETHSVYVAK